MRARVCWHCAARNTVCLEGGRPSAMNTSRQYDTRRRRRTAQSREFKPEWGYHVLGLLVCSFVVRRLNCRSGQAAVRLLAFYKAFAESGEAMRPASAAPRGLCIVQRCPRQELTPEHENAHASHMGTGGTGRHHQYHYGATTTRASHAGERNFYKSTLSHTVAAASAQALLCSPTPDTVHGNMWFDTTTLAP